MRLLVGSLAVAFASFLVACGSNGNDGGDGGASDGGASQGTAPANAVFGVSGVPLLAATENGALASIDGGDVLFAARTAATDLLIARLGPAGEVRWAKT